jgi:lactoylglutathione lyase
MKLKHVSFVCENADLIAEFYTTLGFELEKDLSRPEENLRRLVLKMGEGRIQFFQGQKQPATPSRSWMEHIALELENFEGVIQTLKGKSVIFSREPTLSPSGRRMAFVLDPEGRQVELLEQT